MALEPITRQEQIIAGKDLEPITRMEKFLKEYGGGGGASSWNELTEKPFGEVTTYGDTLTWDGNTEGLESASEALLYRISNVVPTREDFVNGLSVGYAGGEIQLSGEDAQTGFMEDGLGAFDIVFIIPTDNYTAEGCGVFPKAGIYALNDGSVYVSSLTINGYNGFPMKGIKQLDNKYLEPFETVGGDTLTWDGNTEGLTELSLYGLGYFYKVSDATPTTEELSSGIVTMSNGVNLPLSPIPVSDEVVLGESSSYIIAYRDGAIWQLEEGVTITIPKKGLYCVYSLEGEVNYVSSLTINGYTGFTTTKLKEEYIPVDYIKQLIAEATGN